MRPGWCFRSPKRKQPQHERRACPLSMGTVEIHTLVWQLTRITVWSLAGLHLSPAGGWRACCIQISLRCMVTVCHALQAPDASQEKLTLKNVSPNGFSQPFCDSGCCTGRAEIRYQCLHFQSYLFLSYILGSYYLLLLLYPVAAFRSKVFHFQQNLNYS